jgi:hypothetical protein
MGVHGGFKNCTGMGGAGDDERVRGSGPLACTISSGACNESASNRRCFTKHDQAVVAAKRFQHPFQAGEVDVFKGVTDRL